MMLEYYDALYDKHLVNKLGMGTDSDRDRTGTNIRCEYPYQGDIHLLAESVAENLHTAVVTFTCGGVATSTYYCKTYIKLDVA